MSGPEATEGPVAPETSASTATSTSDERGGRRFDPARLRLGIVIALICGALAFLLLQGLGNATTYFYNADEALARRPELGEERIRLQGTVVPGSVRQTGRDVAFQIAYACATVDVRHQGDPPELFADGIPVVLEGAFAAAPGDAYRSDRILVKHTSEYRTEEADRLALAAEQGCPR